MPPGPRTVRARCSGDTPRAGRGAGVGRPWWPWCPSTPSRCSEAAAALTGDSRAPWEGPGRGDTLATDPAPRRSTPPPSLRTRPRIRLRYREIDLEAWECRKGHEMHQER